jgi:hypothetical protein
MVYEKKNEMRGKYLKEPSGWIFGTIKRELNLYASGGDKLEDLQDRHEMTLTYWRQNYRQYPPERLWNTFYYDLLHKSFESRHELRAWCLARLKQLKDPVYLEEEHQQQLKAEEEKRLAREAKKQRRRETLGTWEHYFVKREEANRHARATELVGTTSETWPPPREEPGIFSPSFFEIL